MDMTSPLGEAIAIEYYARLERECLERIRLKMAAACRSEAFYPATPRERRHVSRLLRSM